MSSGVGNPALVPLTPKLHESISYCLHSIRLGAPQRQARVAQLADSKQTLTLDGIAEPWLQQLCDLGKVT